jgi:hypothetical protein
MSLANLKGSLKGHRAQKSSKGLSFQILHFLGVFPKVMQEKASGIKWQKKRSALTNLQPHGALPGREGVK